MSEAQKRTQAWANHNFDIVRDLVRTLASTEERRRECVFSLWG
jgi:hypothetical protein